MYRVVIIDDEPLIIAGIISMIDWHTMECEIVGKFANGAEAWKYMEQNQPDIVITDIKMPLLDGIGLMKKCYENHLDSMFILLTNYGEFSLAQQAVEYGAVDYLLKSSITADILCRSLNKAIDRYEKQRKEKHISANMQDWKNKNQEQVTKEFFRQILLDDEWSKERDKVMETYTIGERFRGFYLAVFAISSAGQKLDKKKMYYAENILQEMVQRYYGESVLFPWEDDSFIVVINSKTGGKEPEIIQMFEKIQSVVKNYFGLDSLAVVSSFRDDVRLVQQQFAEIVECMNYYYYDSSSSIVVYRNILKSNLDTGRKFDISFLKKDIENAVIQRNGAELGRLLSQVRELLLEYKPQKRQAISACTNLYYYISMLFEKKSIFEKGKNASLEENVLLHLNKLVSLQEICQWLEQFQKNICQILDEPSAGRGDWMIQNAIAYIEEHYESKITQQEISEMLGISTGYFSSLFSQKMGKTFSDYVNWVKIRHAQKLLEEHQYMIYEVAEMLGFENAYYFSRVFKKVTGMTPTEYESMVGRK